MVFNRLLRRMETERLLLRRWKYSDFQDFVKFSCDPEVMLPSGAKPASNLEEAERDFHCAMRDVNCYAIILKETGHAVGKIKFQKDIRRWKTKSLSVGYELAKEYWGQGYMPEALRAMIALAFEKEKVEVLGISHFTVNQRSRRVIEKCGFKHEGTVRRAFQRYDGQVFDDECYSILQEEYFSNRERYLPAPPSKMPGERHCEKGQGKVPL